MKRIEHRDGAFAILTGQERRSGLAPPLRVLRRLVGCQRRRVAEDFARDERRGRSLLLAIGHLLEEVAAHDSRLAEGVVAEVWP